MTALAQPRVVMGSPLFNKAEWLPAAVDSILAQSFADFRLVLIDDGSDDATPDICRRYAAEDPRVIFEQNPRRLGMLDNTRRAFFRPRELFPAAPYWALGSDHDIWAPEWMAELVALLDSDPAAVLAYPATQGIDGEGKVVRGPRPSLDTAGIASPRERLRICAERVAAGDMIYGLFRAEAFERVGPYRSLLVPDRLLLAELAWHGTFRQSPAVLWSRRFRGLADLDRQRAAFFVDGRVPPLTRLPWWLSHVAVLALEYGIRGAGRPWASRADGFGMALEYLKASLALRLRRRRARFEKRRDRLVKRLKPRRRRGQMLPRVAEPLYRALLTTLAKTAERPAGRALLTERVAPTLDHAADVLERIAAEVDGDAKTAERSR